MAQGGRTIALTTSRLNLRSLELADAADVSALMTLTISRWLTNLRVPFSTEDAAARIRRIGDAEAAGRACVFGFERKDDARLVGWFGVYLDAIRSTGVLGYWLGEAYQGKGLMREGAPVALACAKKQMTIAAVEAFIHPDNSPSLALARSLGLKAVGEKMIHASARDRDELCIHMAS